MKFCFYAPGDYDDPTIRYSGPSLGLGYLASILQERIPDLEEVTLEVDPQVIVDKKPDMIGISSFTYAQGLAIEGSKHMRAALPDTPIILGGPHISALPAGLHSTMDIGVIGEGEHILVDLVNLFKEDKLTPEYLKHVDSLVYWNENKDLAYSTGAKRIHDLDALPLPDRQFMKAYWPNKDETLEWMPSLSTARGCPFTCGFCMYSQTASLVRYHSADRVMEDLEDIMRQYPTLTHIRITDDLFVTKKGRLKELADHIRAEKYHQKVTFGCMAKASFFDEEYCEILKSMNIAVIAFGFESASDPVLHYLKDTKSSTAKNQRALDLCRKHGIHVGGYFIVGAPPETETDLAKTYWFMSQNNPVMPVVGIFPLIATPGTAVWAEANQRGLIDESYEKWDSFSYHSLENRKYLHLNENYSFDTFFELHQKHFRPVKDRSSFHISFLSVYRSLLMEYYKGTVFPGVHPWVEGKKVFEVGRGDLTIQHLLEECTELKSEFWSESAPQIPEDTDVIYLTHTLEKFGFDSPQWQAIESSGKPVVMTVENTATWGRLISLLKGDVPHGKSLEQFVVFYHYALNTLKSEFKKRGYTIKQMLRHTLPDAESDYVKSLLEPFTNIPINQESDFESYPMLMHILQGFAKAPLIDYCRQHLPMVHFHQEAQVYSYSFWIEKER